MRWTLSIFMAKFTVLFISTSRAAPKPRVLWTQPFETTAYLPRLWFSPDGKFLWDVPKKLTKDESNDVFLRAYDTKNGELKRKILVNVGDSGDGGIGIHPEGQLIALGNFGDFKWEILNTTNENVVSQILTPNKFNGYGFRNRFSFKKDGKTLIFTSLCRIYFFFGQNFDYPLNQLEIPECTDQDWREIADFQLSFNEEKMALTFMKYTLNRPMLLDLKTSEFNSLRYAPLGSLYGAPSFSRDGRYLTGCGTGEVFDLIKQRILFKAPGKRHICSAFSPDGRYLLSVHEKSKTGAILYDAKTFKVIRNLPEFEYVDRVNAAPIFSPDSSRVLWIWDRAREGEYAKKFMRLIQLQ